MGKRSNFYRSKAWADFRRVLMMGRRDKRGILVCEHCGRPIVSAYDCIGHHKEELTEENVSDAEIALNPDNVALVHFRCHNEIHKRFGYGSGEPERRVFYVHGSPLSGKTTFVRNAAGPDDLIVDLDAIYTAIGTRGMHDASPRLKENAFGVRDCLLDQIKTRAGRWRSAWVISTEALATARARMIEQLGAEEIRIDTGKAECLERACTRPDADEARKWVERYWRRWSE